MTGLRRTARLEHRLTRSNASLAELSAAAGLALEHQLATLVVTPWLVRPAARLLARTPVRLATVIGYPHGGQVAAVKAFEASKALEHGATQAAAVAHELVARGFGSVRSHRDLGGHERVTEGQWT